MKPMGNSDKREENRNEQEEETTLFRSGSTTRLKASPEVAPPLKTIPGPPLRKPQASASAQKVATNLLASLPKIPTAPRKPLIAEAGEQLEVDIPQVPSPKLEETPAEPIAITVPAPPERAAVAQEPVKPAPLVPVPPKKKTQDPVSADFAKASMVSAAAMPIASSGMAGPYHLALEIASGGMATVFLAVHGLEGFQNTVAVKRIHPHLAKDKQFVDMFVDEAHIAARINHPYVCRVFDFGKAGDSYYIAMEFLRGEPLSRVFKALTPARLSSARHPTIIARIIANLAEGLHAAHTLKDTSGQSLDVVHRDVTPQNLFVLCDGTVRVTDFGIARARVRSHQTEGGKIKGKLSYMSPEQLNQAPVDCRTDVWSLGVVAWELLTGRRLFRATSEGETVLSVLSRNIPAPSQFESGIPRQLDAIVLKALSRDPAQRYASARELVRALEGFLAAASDTVPSMDLADWIEDLFPGASQRAEGLVQLAHAVIPPEHRASFRPSGAAGSVPVAQVEVSATAKRKNTPRQQQESGKTPLPVVDEPSVPLKKSRLGLGLLVAAAVLGGLGTGVLLTRHAHSDDGANDASQAKVEAPAEPAVTASAAAISTAVPTAAPSVQAPVAQTSSATSDGKPRDKSSARASDVAAKPASVSPSASASAKSTGSEGSVMLMTKNGRAEVYLAGRMLGTTPLTLELPAGNSTLQLKPIGGGEMQSVTVAVKAGSGSLLTVPLIVAAKPAAP